jgi:hypothetical protein
MRRDGENYMKNNMVITILFVIIFAAIGFFGGMKYQESKQPSFSRQFGNGQQGTRMGAGQGGARTGLRQTVGDIISQDDKSITVKLQDGSSKIVFLSDKTTINKTSEGSKSDLKVGDRVGVFGTENSDGSVTAQNVQLNPLFRGMPNNSTPSGTQK